MTELPDPQCTLRMHHPDGTIHEIELNAAQALDLAAGHAIAYLPRDEQILVDDNGTITQRQTAAPE